MLTCLGSSVANFLTRPQFPSQQLPRILPPHCTLCRHVGPTCIPLFHRLLARHTHLEPHAASPAFPYAWDLLSPSARSTTNLLQRGGLKCYTWAKRAPFPHTAGSVFSSPLTAFHPWSLTFHRSTHVTGDPAVELHECRIYLSLHAEIQLSARMLRLPYTPRTLVRVFWDSRLPQVRTC